MTFASVTLPVAAPKWSLTGPAGAGTDTIVASLNGAGVDVEPIVAGTAYRLDGNAELLAVLAEELQSIEGYTLEREAPPTDRIDMRSDVAPVHAPRRSVTVHGSRAHTFIARAIDRRLTVSPAGASRWIVSARTADLVDWLAAVWSQSTDDVMARFSWTPESVAAEDSSTPTVTVANLPAIQVAVTLPDRKTTSEIARDAAGDIRQIVQLETSVEP